MVVRRWPSWPPASTSNVILSEHAEALTARHRHALRRLRIAAQRAVFDWHRQALRAQRNRKRVHAIARLGGRRTDIAARAVMDNDRHGRVHALLAASSTPLSVTV